MVATGSQKLTLSEKLFNDFITEYNIKCKRIPQEDVQTPDFVIELQHQSIAVEIKEIATTEDNSHQAFTVHSKTVGEKIRKAIGEASGQLRWAAGQCMPTILLLFDASSPGNFWHLEDLDFTTAMYGELTTTLNIGIGQFNPMFNGRNELLTPKNRTHISALGRLAVGINGTQITLFPNIFASMPISETSLPNCINFRLIRVDDK